MPPTVDLSTAAREVISDLREDYPELHVLVDDTGCCGSSHVFVQDHPPGPVYEAVGTIGSIDGEPVENVWVHLHPGFQRGTGLDHLRIDAGPTRADDSFSLETRQDVRLTLELAD